MSTAAQPEFVTVDDYLSTEALATTKSEYVDGWVRAMTGATNRHNVVKMNCVACLLRQLRGKRCRPFDSDTKIRIRRDASTRFYYPDLQVVCDSNPQTDVFQDQPALIIEVLSPSTRSVDLDEKLNWYLQIASLQCYVILEQHIPLATVMRRTSAGFLRETFEGIEAKIELPFIDCELPMSDLYDGVEFTPTHVRESEETYDPV